MVIVVDSISFQLPISQLPISAPEAIELPLQRVHAARQLLVAEVEGLQLLLVLAQGFVLLRGLLGKVHVGLLEHGQLGAEFDIVLDQLVAFGAGAVGQGEAVVLVRAVALVARHFLLVCVCACACVFFTLLLAVDQPRQQCAQFAFCLSLAVFNVFDNNF